MVQKKVENTGTQTEENLPSVDNDGFSQSDGEFEIHAEIIIERQRVFKLRNQIRRLKKEHAMEILDKDERIAELENAITKHEKDSIKFEEIESKLKEIQYKNEELVDELDATNRRFSVYQDFGDQMKFRIEAQIEKLRINEEDIEKKNKQLKIKEVEIERLKNELDEFKNDSFEHESNSQEQSQAIYNNFVRDSTASFTDKHAVSLCSSTERHEYAKNLQFWNFDNGPLEAHISN